jgi:hypothetical protein
LKLVEMMRKRLKNKDENQKNGKNKSQALDFRTPFLVRPSKEKGKFPKNLINCRKGFEAVKKLSMTREFEHH